jgi:glycosyltransferase involved in cell wall biosynthesis
LVPVVAAAPRLVCVGRLCEQKGQLLLVRACARLAARKVLFELVLAGDGEMRQEIEREVALLGLQRQVRITGWISAARVREEIVSARALVLPSFAEGLPVVLMEAMALRRPVLTTYVAGIPELVRDGVHGWLLPAGDVEALVRALEECLAASDGTLARMGEAGRARVLAAHSIEAEAAKLARLFRAAPLAQAAAAVPRAAESAGASR